ncbi:KGK domain-containing protein [Nostoc sp.]|uniref:KGK domain-containing protein n=1 Tax=Nostoc sp. TaxID=1180 RepID=UPI002FF4FDD5
MSNIYQLLDFGADVLLFNNDTYIVSRFKELISENFSQKFRTQLKENHSDFSVSGLFNKLCINEDSFQAENITWQSSKEGINCKVFKVGSTDWQAGKLKIKVSTEIISPCLQHKFIREDGNLNITIALEFYPDNSNETESPLDDLRKMIQST